MAYKHKDLNDDNQAYIVMGSNLTESILGAGLALAGEKCVFIDSSDRYGGILSSFNLERYFKYLDEKRASTAEAQLAMANQDGLWGFRVLKSYDLGQHKDENAFKRHSRNYNVDLIPKLLFSKSTSVDLLIKSGASNYLEFQQVPEIYYFMRDAKSTDQSCPDGKFAMIPFSKGEIFMSESLSLREKRQLVKVIGLCLNGYDTLSETEITSQMINSTRAYEKLDTTLSKEDIQMLLDFKDKPITEFLDSLKISLHL